jgi:hypothetical protein
LQGRFNFFYTPIKTLIESKEFAQRVAKEAKFFTRNRILTLPHLVCCLMNYRKGTILDELGQFYKALLGPDTPPQVTPAAFCKARQKLKFQAFPELNQVAVAAFGSHFALRRWHGFRVLAVDGSTGRLPNEEDIVKVFGGPVDANGPMARYSRLFDVLNKIIVVADIEPYAVGERELASPYLYAAVADDLLVYDRGYPAFWLFAQHRDMERHFCARASLSFCSEVETFVASGLDSAVVTLSPSAEAKRQCAEYNLSSEPVTVRMIRVELNSGETEVLITSLLDEAAYPTGWFKKLYHLRWGVEGEYEREKCRIEIENCSGKSPLVVYQDFHAKILALNLTSMLAWVAQAVADRLYRDRQHPYQINFANALTQMKNDLVRWLLGTDPWKTLCYLLTEMAKAVEPVRPDRSYPRNMPAQKLHAFHPTKKRTR